VKKPRLGRPALLTSLLLALAGCPECDPTSFQPAGSLSPPILDLGPVPLDEECLAILQVQNRGTADLQVEGAALRDTNGDWVVQQVPQLVGLGGNGELLLRYKSSGTVNQRQSVTVQVTTNDRLQEGGVLTAVVQAIPVAGAAGIAVARCGVREEGSTERVPTIPCPELDFGAVQVNTPGQPASGRRNLQVEIINQGNAELDVLAAIIDGGDGDFQVAALLKGSLVVSAPVTLTPGRAGPCEPVGEASCVNADNCNVLTLDLVYTPTALGADAATLVVLTDAAEGGTLEIPLSGLGSDVGIALFPDFVNFSDVGEGQSGSVDVRVVNIGTNEAPVNNTCIDLGGTGTCDGECTGGENQRVLNGTLGCDVKKDDGSNEGKGFVLGPTDARAGGDDERVLIIDWSPTAGNASIPAGTVIQLQSGILGNRVYTLPLGGGGAGVLALDADAQDICGSMLCIQAQSATPADPTTWMGAVDFTLRNDGDATLQISSFTFDANNQPTIEDDFDLADTNDAPINQASPGITLAPGASIDLRVLYENNDQSQQDLVNLVVAHTGLGESLLIPFNVLPPQ
jgi:hypothetical protein